MSARRDLIDRLPELPLETFEAVGTLERSTRGPYVTLRPHAPRPPVAPGPLPHEPNLSSHAIKRYFTQAMYPRLICYDPGDLVVGLSMNLARTSEPALTHPPVSPAALAGHERVYKLSALGSVRFHEPLWCSVKYGPWLAVVQETESCTAGAPSRWEFSIVELPEVSLVWDGAWLDMPPLPSLIVTMNDLALTHVAYECCPGYKWCVTTQSCIPLQVTCQDPIPQ